MKQKINVAKNMSEVINNTINWLEEGELIMGDRRNKDHLERWLKYRIEDEETEQTQK